jgi:hypothetical protein
LSDKKRSSDKGQLDVLTDALPEKVMVVVFNAPNVVVSVATQLVAVFQSVKSWLRSEVAFCAWASILPRTVSSA